MTRPGRGLLILHDNPGFGGHERIFLAMLPRLLDRGDFSRVTLRHAAANTQFAAALAPFADRIRIVTGRHESGRAGPLLARFRRSYAREVRALHAAEAPERTLIVQGRIESVTVPVVALPRDARLLSYIPMAHPRSVLGFQPFGDALRRPFYRRIDRFIVPSRAVEAQLRSVGAQGAVRVVGNSVAPPANPGRAAARLALGIPGDAQVALFLGRLDVKQKGIDRLLAAIARDRANLAEWRFLFVGSGRGAALVGRAATGRPALGSVPWTDTPHLYLAAADVLLLPSRWEGVPLVALEAMAYAIPILASTIPELAELLPPANLSDFREPLSAALARVVAPEARAAFAAHANAYAFTHRSAALADAFAEAVAD